MKKLSNFIYFLTTLLFFTYVDFYFSAVISQKLLGGKEFSNFFFKSVYIENTGAAFSILQNSTNLLIIFSVIALLGIFYYMARHMKNMKMKTIFFTSLLISGILGNLYERIVFGFVRDFFELTFVNFPIFNISDIFINVGVFGIIVLILLSKKPIKLL